MGYGMGGMMGGWGMMSPSLMFGAVAAVSAFTVGLGAVLVVGGYAIHKSPERGRLGNCDTCCIGHRIDRYEWIFHRAGNWDNRRNSGADKEVNQSFSPISFFYNCKVLLLYRINAKG